MLPEIIKDKEIYQQTLNEIEILIESDPDSNSQDGKRLELLVHLVEIYEKEKLKKIATNPIDAIRFRMEQENLKQVDLVPFIGSRSKVSEILSGKRPLTLSMIQAIHNGLGIPADSLLLPSETEKVLEDEIDWNKFPINEMCKRGWIGKQFKDAKNNIERIISDYISSVCDVDKILQLNKTSSHRLGRKMDRYALIAWTARIVKLALDNPPINEWKPELLNWDVMREIVNLSVLPDGPLRAKEKLRHIGISLITESSLPKTYLDGSAIMIYPKHPIIGLSLRYDRVDNFWFCLMHELSHVSLHYDKGVKQFYDDLDITKFEDELELEADNLAYEMLIPKEKWQSSPARVAPTKDTVLRFARLINVHPAIVAGRIRRERNSYHLFNDIVGHGRIKYLFRMEDENEE